MNALRDLYPVHLVNFFVPRGYIRAGCVPHQHDIAPRDIIIPAGII